MYKNILDYLSKADDDLDFQKWSLVTAVVLQNQKKSGQAKYLDHFVLSTEDLETRGLDVLGIGKKIWRPREYNALSTVFMASTHCAKVKNNSPILSHSL